MDQWSLTFWRSFQALLVALGVAVPLFATANADAGACRNHSIVYAAQSGPPVTIATLPNSGETSPKLFIFVAPKTWTDLVARDVSQLWNNLWSTAQTVIPCGHCSSGPVAPVRKAQARTQCGSR